MPTNDLIESLTKVIPAIAAVAGAVLKLLPSASAAARKRETTTTKGTGIRISEYKTPHPWTDKFYNALTSDSYRRRRWIRIRSIFFCAVGLILCASFAALYVYLATEHAASTAWFWSAVLAVLTALVIAISLVKALYVLSEDGQFTAAVTQTGFIVVKSSIADVEQYAFSNLSLIGAKVVETVRSVLETSGRSECHGCSSIAHSAGKNEDDDQVPPPQESDISETLVIYGSVGLRILPILFLGEFIEVTVSCKAGTPSGSSSSFEVQIQSTKLDFLTPSRSRKNIVGYLSSWVALPSTAANSTGPTGE